MPFRFRKIISFGKGFRLNLSKGGVSSSIGTPGFTLNLGKRGVRPTISAPGTGLSYTPSQAAASRGKAKPNQNLTTNCLVGVISLALICIISICCIGVIFADPLGLSTPTPQALLPIGTIVAQTRSAAHAQTLAVSTSIPPPLTSTSVLLPTFAVSPLAIPPTFAPTWTPLPTFTPFVLNTPNAPPIAPGNAVCLCDRNRYSCVLSDFSTHAEAQACYDYCVSQGAGDIHGLDGNDNDGLACESLP